MAVAALNQSGRGAQIFAASGEWLLIGWGWGFAVAFAVYVAGGVSGDYGNVNTYFWIPIVAPFLGGVVGAFVYDLCIRDTLLARGETPPPDVEARGRTVEEEA
jgi:glycerol uptake facilitator-like aquaporin